MNWESIAIYLILIGIGVLIGSIKDVGKNTVGWVLRMIGTYFKQKLIEKGIIMGDFPIDVAKFSESTKEPVDSDWSIRITSHHGRTIGKCRVLLDGKKLQWANKKGGYEIPIEPYSAKNVRIPKGEFPKNARVQVWDCKNILFNEKFEELPLLD